MTVGRAERSGTFYFKLRDGGDDVVSSAFERGRDLRFFGVRRWRLATERGSEASA